MRILLDAMGSDDHPAPEIAAARAAAERWSDTLLLVGDEGRLRPALDASPPSAGQVEIVHAPEILGMTDKPADAVRGKPRSSMAVGLQLLADGGGDAFVTAGNTGGAMATALFRLGRLRGVKRPALCATFPVHGGTANVIDLGANTDCRPEYLLQFAVMGSVYAQAMLDRPRPRVALLSNGEEAGKGNELVKEAYPLLERSGLNFLGNLEPKEFYAGGADVLVCDGFVGNILLKTSEAVAAFLVNMIRAEIRAGAVSTLGGLLARPAFRRVGAVLDPAEYGAVPLLGVNGLVFIGHGRSDARALESAIAVARRAVEGGLLGRIAQAIQAGLEVIPRLHAPGEAVESP